MAKYLGSVYPFVQQGEYWMTKDGPVSIEQMTPDHRRQSARWLYERATPLILLCEQEINVNGTGRFDEPLQAVMGLMSMGARDWITGTPLYRSLTA